MSVANHKKSENEIARNSLVVESIIILKNITPKFFIFENVSAFMKTICTDIDGEDKTISRAIEENLGDIYTYQFRTINFKNYGSNSSRSRTLVIGVRKDLSNYISPIDLFPSFVKEKTLRECIGHLVSLKNPYDFDESDIYHNFRFYDERMRSWIHNVPEGGSAFDNDDILNRPHKVINNQIIENVNKNGDKYTRQCWDKVAPCIHTRNDLLASQNTIHPSDDRVFSIRELMILMSIPNSFKWSNIDDNILNSYPKKDKIRYLKKEEINIRQSIGEAVPTGVFLDISNKISNYLNKENLTHREIVSIINEKELSINGNIVNFIKENSSKYNYSTLCKIVEFSNAQRNEQSAFYTDKFLTDYLFSYLPDLDGESVRILEPSVGAGNFIPCVLKKYENKKIIMDLLDIDQTAIEALKELVKLFENLNVEFNFINDDYLLHQFDCHYDLIVGNPPFSKINKGKELFKKYYNQEFIKNTYSTNLSSLFLEKSCALSNNVFMIMPKNILNTPEFLLTRNFLSTLGLNSIIDLGEKGFKGVLVETICLSINTKKTPTYTKVVSLTHNLSILQKQKYITSAKLPYWIIYRNKNFDSFVDEMQFNVFSVFRDRQIVNSNLTDEKGEGDIRVIKSRNINDTGEEIVNIHGYDSFISLKLAEKIEAFKFYNRDDVYLTPNMTYKTRVMKKEKGYIVNGSVAVLMLKQDVEISKQDLLYFSTSEYRDFLQIARNYQTRSINIDSNSVYFLGIKRRDKDEMVKR